MVKSLNRISVGESISRHTPEVILKPIKSGRGYLTVCLRDGVTTRRKYIHRLVATYFVDNPNGHPFVNHLDGNKENNWYKNLEWSTPAKNNQHAYNTGLKLRGEQFYNSKLTEDDVREILLNGKYTTYQEIANEYGVTKATIRDVLERKTWKHICID